MSTPTSRPPAAGRSLSDTVLAAVLVTVIITALVVLAESGRDVSTLMAFVGGPAVSGLLGLLLVKRQADIATAVQAVAEQTNGKLTGALADIQDTAQTTLVDLHATAERAQRERAAIAEVAQQNRRDDAAVQRPPLLPEIGAELEGSSAASTTTAGGPLPADSPAAAAATTA